MEDVVAGCLKTSGPDNAGHEPDWKAQMVK
jgi:hypothetical protein